MDKLYPEILPDLTVNVCPLGCNERCAGIWTNKTIGHKIVCKCPCGHNKKQVALQLVGEPEAKATKEILPSSQEVVPKR